MANSLFIKADEVLGDLLGEGYNVWQCYDAWYGEAVITIYDGTEQEETV